jgi:hypothetical protein
MIVSSASDYRPVMSLRCAPLPPENVFAAAAIWGSADPSERSTAAQVDPQPPSLLDLAKLQNNASVLQFCTGVLLGKWFDFSRSWI